MDLTVLLRLFKLCLNFLMGTRQFNNSMCKKQLDFFCCNSGCDNFSVMATATFLYNVLDMPVGCLPVTRVDPEKDQIDEAWEKGPGFGSSILESGIYRGKQPLYNPKQSKGMPVNIQIVGKKWEEEKILGIMDVVDNALGKERGFGPGAWDAYMKTS